MKTYSINNAGTLCQDLNRMLSDDINRLVNQTRFIWGDYSENLCNKFVKNNEVRDLPIFKKLIENKIYIGSAFIDYVKPNCPRAMFNVNPITNLPNDAVMIIPLHIPTSKIDDSMYVFFNQEYLEMYNEIHDIMLVTETFEALGQELTESQSVLKENVPLIIKSPGVWAGLSNVSSDDYLISLRISFAHNPSFDSVISSFN